MLGIGVSLRHLRGTTAAVDAYKVDSFKPDLVFDFANEYYRTDSLSTTFDSAITHTRNSNATMVDSDGLLKWAPHNLLTYSEDFSNAAWIGSPSSTQVNVETAPDGSLTADRYTFNSGTWFKQQNHATVSGVSYTISVWLKSVSGTQTIRLYGSNADASPNIEVTENWQLFSHTFTATTTGSSTGAGVTRNTSNSAADFYLWGAHVYRSDLGGMVDNPDQPAGFETYVPTTSAARYLARRGHHVYNGAEWVNEGVLVEPTGAVQLLHTTDSLVTQSHTVTAEPHTLHFTGTGTVTLSGAYSGSLVGTGTGEENRVSLTFTPTAASLTLTVSGTVSDAQLEVGSVPTSYIPNLAGSGTVTRAADDADSDNLTYDSSAMWFTLSGLQTFADEGAAGQEVPFDWRADANNRITVTIDTDGAETGEITLTVVSGGTTWSVAQDYLSPGVNVPFNIAWRVTDTEINVAAGGTSATAVATTSIPDLSSASAAFDGNGVYSLFRQGIGDIGDSGIAEAST